MTQSVRQFVPAAFLIVVAAGMVAGCAGHSQRTRSAFSPTGTQLVTTEMIEASGAKTAWDALRLTVPNFGFRETSRGTPARVVHRGRSTIYLDDQPRVFLDGTRLTDFQVLDQMPAVDVWSIEVISGIEATTYYGTGSGNGVILIHTRIAV